jgi:hypothetical protein
MVVILRPTITRLVKKLPAFDVIQRFITMCVRANHFSIVKPARCTISQIYFILEQHSTCFGRAFRPSSGV